MKYFNFIKYCLLTVLFVFAGFCFTACDDDIKLPVNGDYDNIDDVYGSVKNVSGARELSTITIFGTNTGTGQLYFELTEAASEEVTVQLKVDEAALTTYNKAHGTSYDFYRGQVSLANNGVVNIASGSQKSEEVAITIASNGETGSTYALPISAEVTVGGVKVSKANASYIYLIKQYPAIPSSDKGTGIKSILYIEVNDENILNAGEYTMAGSGKPFFDVVNIFAANINYNSDTKRAYVFCNENVSHILKNADQFIRPLQAKGIKVCLTILGNHDEAGVANLSPEAAADFARELKSYVDVYGLDGIDFDDEYSKYANASQGGVPSPGFEYPSGAAAARLVYECRKIMPDKIISVYDYTNYLPTGTVEGEQVGTLMDYSYWGAYADWRDRSSIVTGLGKAKYGPSSFNLDFSASRSGYDLSHCAQLRTDGYGIQMFYNLKPNNYDYSKAFNALGNVLFDDNVVWTGRVYNKTDVSGSIYKPSYESYIGTWTLKPSQGLFWYTPGPWWDWKDNVSYTLRIEENVVDQSYKVYGWGETGDDLPLIMNYNEFGRIEINLPQTVTASDNSSWQYMARQNYSLRYVWFVPGPVAPAFTGYINSSGNFTIRSMKSNFTTIKTMAPIQYTGGDAISDMYGGLYQDVAYEPYTMIKQ